MRKIKSLALIALTSFAIAACSSGNKEVEQASVDELYAKGAAALQEGSYSDSIRYLKAATERFPGSTYHCYKLQSRMRSMQLVQEILFYAFFFP